VLTVEAGEAAILYAERPDWLRSRTNTSLRAAARWKTYVVMNYQSA
jgi:hypothetical protein